MIAAVAMVADLAVDTLARTVWGEARGEGEAGMIAVAAVVRNRVDLSARLGGRHWWGHDWIGVCRARGQFASWNPGNPNRAKLLTVSDSDPDFRRAKRIAADAIAGRIDDPTRLQGRCAPLALHMGPFPPAAGRDRQARLLQLRQGTVTMDETPDASPPASRRNLRADVLAYAAIGGMISLIWALLVRQIPEGSTRDILLILSGALVAIVKDVYGFEFGSSRGSEVKTEQLGRIVSGSKLPGTASPN